MKNSVFRRISPEEKRRHLVSVIKNRSGGHLDDRAIRRIMQSVSIHSQYRVRVFSDRRAFSEAAAHSRVVRSKHGGRVSAAVTYGRKRAINIWKGAQTWEKASKNG